MYVPPAAALFKLAPLPLPVLAVALATGLAVWPGAWLAHRAAPRAVRADT